MRNRDKLIEQHRARGLSEPQATVAADKFLAQARLAQDVRDGKISVHDAFFRFNETTKRWERKPE